MQTRTTRVRTGSCWLAGVGVGLLVALATPAGAESADADASETLDAIMGADDENRGPNWIPSLAVGFSLYSQPTRSKVSGQVWAGGTTGNPLFTPLPSACGDSTVRFVDLANHVCFDTNDDPLDGFAIPVSFMLSGPVLDVLPGDARPFAQCGYLVPGEDRSRLASDGPIDFGEPATSSGQLARIDVTARPRSRWFCGGGASFRLPFESYDVRLRTSVNYMFENMRVTGSVVDQSDVGRIIRTSSASELETYHSLGGGLGLDVELGRSGPLAYGLFFDLMGFFVLNDRETSFTVPGPITTPGIPFSNQATMNFSVRPWHIIGLLGARVSWVGTSM